MNDLAIGFRGAGGEHQVGVVLNGYRLWNDVLCFAALNVFVANVEPNVSCILSSEAEPKSVSV